MEEIDSWESLIAALRQIAWEPLVETPDGTLDCAYCAPSLDPCKARWFYVPMSKRISTANLLTFVWAQGYSELTCAAVDVVWIDNIAYMSYWLGPIYGATAFFVMRVRPGKKPALLRRALFDLLNLKLDDFAVAAGCPPEMVRNNSPHLIDRATAKEMFSCLVDPVKPVGYYHSDTLHTWLSDEWRKEYHISGLTYTKREQILEDYFSRCYVEAHNAIHLQPWRIVIVFHRFIERCSQ